MVDVSAKPVTERVAVAEGHVLMRPKTLAIVATASQERRRARCGPIAGIMAAKRTHELIPLCHPLPITQVEVDFMPVAKLPGMRVTASVKVAARPASRWRR